MGRFTNEAGIIVSVDDSRDGRYTAESGWKPVEPPVEKPAAKPAAKPSASK